MGKQLARRWRSLNRLAPEESTSGSTEDRWREQTLQLLSDAHTIGGIAELSFQVVESQYSVRPLHTVLSQSTHLAVVLF
jgi:hypothetical protein